MFTAARKAEDVHGLPIDRNVLPPHPQAHRPHLTSTNRSLPLERNERHSGRASVRWAAWKAAQGVWWDVA
ncbi:hypothetical protein GCM10022221_31100 [Actinocorallia aurea]